MTKHVHISAELVHPYVIDNPLAVFDLHSEEIYFSIHYFLGPIDFRIGCFDIGLSTGMGILGFALNLKRILNRLSAPGTYVLASMCNEQDIQFSRNGVSDQIVVTRLWRGDSVAVGHLEILAAADHFLQDLLDDLTHRFPQLVGNPKYTDWRFL